MRIEEKDDLIWVRQSAQPAGHYDHCPAIPEVAIPAMILRWDITQKGKTGAEAIQAAAKARAR
jgi:hypothetical protein